MPPPGSTTRRAAAHAPLPWVGFLLLAGLTLFWGANWPAMKIAFTELPVWWFRAGCLWFGGLGLVAIARLDGMVALIMACGLHARQPAVPVYDFSRPLAIWA